MKKNSLLTNLHVRFRDLVLESKNKIIENKEEDNIYFIVVKLKVPKKEQGFEALVQELLNDIRAVTRVTVVSSLDSHVKDDSKIVTAKIKFNSKNLYHEGYESPESFVKMLLVPTIQKLDSRPRILSVTHPQKK